MKHKQTEQALTNLNARWWGLKYDMKNELLITTKFRNGAPGYLEILLSEDSFKITFHPLSYIIYGAFFVYLSWINLESYLDGRPIAFPLLASAFIAVLFPIQSVLEIRFIKKSFLMKNLNTTNTKSSQSRK